MSNDVSNEKAGERVKIRFELDESDKRRGVLAETLWAEDLTGDLYKIDSIPFYAYGVSYCDVVRARISEGHLDFIEVVRRGGHSTYRLLMTENCLETDCCTSFRKTLIGFGCSYELARRRWFAIDVPSTTDVSAVYEFLEGGERNGSWEFFEEAHFGHSPTKAPSI